MLWKEYELSYHRYLTSGNHNTNTVDAPPPRAGNAALVVEPRELTAHTWRQIKSKGWLAQARRSNPGVLTVTPIPVILPPFYKGEPGARVDKTRACQAAIFCWNTWPLQHTGTWPVTIHTFWQKDDPIEWTIHILLSEGTSNKQP